MICPTYCMRHTSTIKLSGSPNHIRQKHSILHIPHIVSDLKRYNEGLSSISSLDIGTQEKGKRWSRPCPCPVLIESSVSWHCSTTIPVMFKKLICLLSDEMKQTIFSAEATGLIRSYRLVILNNRLSRNRSRSHHRCAVLQSQQKTHLSLSSIRENIPFSPAPLERER